MFIKEIKISGFKSYKEETHVENLSQGHNVVVGRNGSGKSSLFAAIRFVLGDAYTRLGNEERQALIHEDAGPTPMASYVEIVFDNKDGRFPTGRETVVLRRTIGLKKDEYMLDGRSVSKADVSNLLQSAGFSKANPYYIVPQGRVTSLTNAKEHERLQLLKEIAGTKVYEEHREESVGILRDTQKKRQKIKELMEAAERRMEELEEDQKELKRYSRAEEEIRVLECSLYDAQIAEAADELRRLSEVGATQEDMQGEVEELEGKIDELSQHVREQRKDLAMCDSEKEELERELSTHRRARQRLEARREEAERHGAERKKTGEIVEEIKRKIAEKESELRGVYSRMETAKERELDMQREIETLELEAAVLGRRKSGEKTPSQGAGIEKEIKERRKELERAVLEREELGKPGRGKEKRTPAERKELEEERERLDKKHFSAVEERKASWRTELKMEGVVESAASEMAALEKSIAVPRDAFAGLRSLSQMGALEGVYGALYTLFSADEIYWRAIESVCGSGLFSVLVDTEETAVGLVKRLKEHGGGRLTFILLNRIEEKDQAMCETDIAFPLMKKISYKKEFEAVFLHFFSRVFLVPDVSFGSSFAKKNKVVAVTLDGDVCRERGTLSGGYTKKGGKILSPALRLSQWKEKQQAAIEQLGRARRRIAETNEVLGALSEEKRLVEHRLRVFELAQTVDREEMAESAVHRKQVEILEHRKELQVLEEKRRLFESEKKEGKFTGKEEKRLQGVLSGISRKKKEAEKVVRETMALELERNKTRDELELSLRRRLCEIEAEWKEAPGTRTEAELVRIDSHIAEDTKAIGDIDERARKARRAEHRLESELEQHRVVYEEKRKQSEEKGAEAEKAFFKRAVITRRRDELVQKVRAFGVPASPLREECSRLEQKELLRRLYSSKEELAKHGSVNKAAVEQYGVFSKQRAALGERKKELDSSEESIERFLGVLEQQKSETIEKTFEQVAENFAATWTELVPDGEGELLVIREDPPAARPGQIAAPCEVLGVDIAVSFHGASKVSARQLSGGQKSLVALCLIFAIQQCDPAPFYLFDEVDANLDSVHRKSVAGLLRKMSSTAQFITTTFRAEMLESADVFYGVSVVEGSSTAVRIGKEVAMQFVEQSQS
ncbi:MAG: structural maintenance of chromosomes protein 3 [Amphiamblys sp. WSBS2006]|nr:MAG: structural maintenance of chromosomes protein 3 [Amphiamblys sp. WSBS2006]